MTKAANSLGAAFLCLFALVFACSRPGPASGPLPRPAGKPPGEPQFMPDWSTAGYRFGGYPSPTWQTVPLSGFGALPNDGKADDDALAAALTESPRGAILEFEDGVYDFQSVVFVRRGHIRLSGHGKHKTTLRFHHALEDLPPHPRTQDLRSYLVENQKRAPSGAFFSPFSWQGGLIWIESPERSGRLIKESGLSGKRGSRELVQKRPTPDELLEGETYVLAWLAGEAPEQSLLPHIFGRSDLDFGSRLKQAEQVLAHQTISVTSVEAEETHSIVRFREPLLHDLRPEFQVALGQNERMNEVHLKGLRLEFAEQAYRGHHEEAGYNGVYLTDCSHCTLEDIRVINADSALLSDRSDHVTISGLEVQGRGGHYGVHLGSVYGMLLRDFSIAGGFEHSLSFNTGSNGNVMTQGVVESGRLDQHRGSNHQNLYDSISVRSQTSRLRLFDHGGAAYFGPAHGAYNTFWNLRISPAASETNLDLGEVQAAGPANFCGLSVAGRFTLNYPSRVDFPADRHGWSGESSLYEAQVQRAEQQANRTP